MKKINVTKSSGKKEPFDAAELLRSLHRLGVGDQLADFILNHIQEGLFEGVSTRIISREIHRQLRQYNNNEGIRYEPGPAEHLRPTDREHESLEELQRQAFDYFMLEINPVNGLIADNSRLGSPSSIASVGFALAVYVVGVWRGWMSRKDAVQRVRSVFHFFLDSEQGKGPEATGYMGFYYHFLDMDTGRRAGKCELSTIDTCLLVAGMLTAARFFNRDNQEEAEIRSLSDRLFRRIDWQWACNGSGYLSHGWTPEEGFLPYSWQGYDEAALMYLLGLGAPCRALTTENYRAWTSGFSWEKIYGHEYIYGGPLFIHQYSHIWVDFREIQDDYVREKGIDYFENSRQATWVQQQYAIRNPLGFESYGEHFWGLTASDGPGWKKLKIKGKERSFWGYTERGAPYGPDDGTIAPWVVLASLPFAPEIVMPTIQNFREVYPQITGKYCLRCSFNLNFPNGDGADRGWTSSYHYGINLGPIVLMIENYRSQLLWELMRKCPYLIRGLRKAGFRGGWLEA